MPPRTNKSRRQQTIVYNLSSASARDAFEHELDLEDEQHQQRLAGGKRHGQVGRSSKFSLSADLPLSGHHHGDFDEMHEYETPKKTMDMINLLELFGSAALDRDVIEAVYMSSKQSFELAMERLMEIAATAGDTAGAADGAARKAASGSEPAGPSTDEHAAGSDSGGSAPTAGAGTADATGGAEASPPAGTVEPERCYWETLPEDLKRHVFSFLNSRDLARVARTCKDFAGPARSVRTNARQLQIPFGLGMHGIMAMVAGHPNARAVSLRQWAQAPLSDSDFTALVVALSAGSRSERRAVPVEALSFKGCRWLSDGHVMSLCSTMQHLKEVDLTDCVGITDAALVALAKYQRLAPEGDSSSSSDDESAYVPPPPPASAAGASPPTPLLPPRPTQTTRRPSHGADEQPGHARVGTAAASGAEAGASGGGTSSGAATGGKDVSRLQDMTRGNQDDDEEELQFEFDGMVSPSPAVRAGGAAAAALTPSAGAARGAEGDGDGSEEDDGEGVGKGMDDDDASSSSSEEEEVEDGKDGDTASAAGSLTGAFAAASLGTPAGRAVRAGTASGDESVASTPLYGTSPGTFAGGSLRGGCGGGLLGTSYGAGGSGAAGAGSYRGGGGSGAPGSPWLYGTSPAAATMGSSAPRSWLYGSSPVMGPSPFFRTGGGGAGASVTHNGWLARAASAATHRSSGRGLMSINLSGCSAISSDGVKALLSASIPKACLLQLDISRCPRITRAALVLPATSNLCVLRAAACHNLHEVIMQLPLTSPLTELTLADCKALTKLHVVAPALQQLHVGSCRHLTRLHLRCPQLRSLTASLCFRLVDLDPERWDVARLERLNLFGCRHLEWPGLATLLARCGPALRHLDVNGCNGLVVMDVPEANDGLQHLDISGCKSLTVLRCPSPALAALTARSCPRLQELGLGSAALARLDISNCPHLQRLTMPALQALHQGLMAAPQPQPPAHHMLHGAQGRPEAAGSAAGASGSGPGKWASGSEGGAGGVGGLRAAVGAVAAGVPSPQPAGVAVAGYVAPAGVMVRMAGCNRLPDETAGLLRRLRERAKQAAAAAAAATGTAGAGMQAAAGRARMV